MIELNKGSIKHWNEISHVSFSPLMPTFVFSPLEDSTRGKHGIKYRMAKSSYLHLPGVVVGVCMVVALTCSRLHYVSTAFSVCA